MLNSKDQTLTTIHLIVHTDGGSRGNPGPAATGIVVSDASNKIVHSFGRYLGVATNNVAEYSAVYDALSWIIGHYPSPHPSLSFFLDSNLCVQQLNRVYKIKEPKLFDLATKIWELINSHNLNVSFSYVPREENRLADKEVNLTLDAFILK